MSQHSRGRVAPLHAPRHAGQLPTERATTAALIEPHHPTIPNLNLFTFAIDRPFVAVANTSSPVSRRLPPLPSLCRSPSALYLAIYLPTTSLRRRRTQFRDGCSRACCCRRVRLGREQLRCPGHPLRSAEYRQSSVVGQGFQGSEPVRPSPCNSFPVQPQLTVLQA